jgi:hypothetical protein
MGCAAKSGVTAVLQRAQNRAPETNLAERGFRFIAFDATSEYGNSPGRPLMLLAFGILLFTLPYTFCLMITNPERRGAIWIIWDEDRLLDRSGNRSSRAVVFKRGLGKVVAQQRNDARDNRDKRERLSGLNVLNALRYGLYFSLLSAFHFGWRDLNVGNWITRIQPREYVLRASGWVRVVSGSQSLISVYLVALWVLTYFGRPFE